MAVDRPRRDDQARGVDHRGPGVEHHVDVVHRVGIPGAPDGRHAPAGDADARALHAEHRVEQEPAGDRDLDAAAARPHPEAVAHGAAPAGEQLVRPSGRVDLRLYDEAGVAELRAARRVDGLVGEPGLRHRGTPARARARGRAPVHRGRPAARRRGRRDRAPRARRRSAAAARETCSPGGNTTFSPAGIARRMPQVASRSNRRSRLASKKWKCEVTATRTAPSFVTSAVAAASSLQVGGTDAGCGGPLRITGSCRTSRRIPSSNSASTSTRGIRPATPSSTSSSPSSV